MNMYANISLIFKLITWFTFTIIYSSFRSTDSD